MIVCCHNKTLQLQLFSQVRLRTFWMTLVNPPHIYIHICDCQLYFLFLYAIKDSADIEAFFGKPLKRTSNSSRLAFPLIPGFSLLIHSSQWKELAVFKTIDKERVRYQKKKATRKLLLYLPVICRDWVSGRYSHDLSYHLGTHTDFSTKDFCFYKHFFFVLFTTYSNKM